MKLKELSLNDLEQVRQWRNSQIEMLRTPFLLTKEQQEEFYHNVICNRQANARYWAILADDNQIMDRTFNGIRIPIENTKLLGMYGIENIQWENRLGEISLIMNPEYQDRAKEALSMLLHEGFNNLNLENIYTEVYDCSPYQQFWIDTYIQHCGTQIPMITLPNRKYYNGKYYNSLYINFNKERYNDCK